MPILIKDPEAIPILQYIKEYFTYSEEHKGLIYKKITGATTRNKLGQKAGGIHPLYGYIAIKIRGRAFRAHRLVFLLHHGRWPSGELDHINGNNADNRIENLRESTRSQNCANRKTWTKKNKYKGVCFFKSRNQWRSYIRINKKEHELGFSDTEELAAKSYDEAAIKAFGQFANINFGGTQ